jgi:molybdopterin synthase sulfur carrier subunit
MATVRIPTPLRPLSKGRAQVDVTGKSVREVMANLEKECDGLGNRIYDDQGELRRFVNIYLNDEDIRHLKGLDTPVSEKDVLSIVPAIAGGFAGR